jgi:hypothetical protein
VRALSRGSKAESAREGLVDDLKDEVLHHLLDIQRQLSAGPWHLTMAAGPEGCHIGFAARSLAKAKRA